MYVHFTLHPSYHAIVLSLVFNIITFTDIIILCDYIDLGSNRNLDKQISQLVKSLAKINLYAFLMVALKLISVCQCTNCSTLTLFKAKSV